MMNSWPASQAPPDYFEGSPKPYVFSTRNSHSSYGGHTEISNEGSANLQGMNAVKFNF